MIKSKWLDLVLDINIMALIILSLIFFHALWIHYTFEIIIKYLYRKSSFQCNFILFWTYFWQLLVQYQNLRTHFHHLLEYVIFFCDFFCQHKFFGFVDQYVFEMFITFFSQNSKLEFCFESLSLKHVQGSRVVHFTMLAPNLVFPFFKWCVMYTSIW